MDTKTTKPTSAQAAKPAANAPSPDFDSKTAQRIEPAYRHEETKRTVGFHQPGKGNEIHLFSATRVFVATVKATPKESAPQPAPAPAPEPSPAAPAEDKLNTK